MATPKNPDLVKKTMNFRKGDFEKMDELFPSLSASEAIRKVISAFVDKHHHASVPPELAEEPEL